MGSEELSMYAVLPLLWKGGEIVSDREKQKQISEITFQQKHIYQKYQ